MEARVLYVLGSGELAGIQRHLHGVLRNLPLGIRPEVCVLFEGGVGTTRMVDDGVPVAILGCRNGHDPRLLIRFARAISRFGPDVVHEHEAHLLSLAVMLRQRNGPVLVHTEHCALDRTTSRWKDAFLYALISRRADAITGVSEATVAAVKRIARRRKGRLQCIPNGVDVRRLGSPANLRRELGLPEDTILVGAVGRLAEQKGWPDFVATSRLLAADDLRVHVVIAGDGPLRSQVEDLVRRTGLPDRYHLLGSRPDGDSVLGGLDLFLLTSIHEEMPTTVLEALAQGTPIAGFAPAGGFTEIVARAEGQTAALVVPVRDPMVLAAAVRQLLHDKPRLKQQAQAGRSIVAQHFDMVSIARQYAELYRTCLNEPLHQASR